MDQRIYILFLIAAIALLASTIIDTITSISNRKHVEKLTMYQINSSITIDESIPSLLELVINESFNDFKAKNAYIINNMRDYINEDKEIEIRNSLVEMVTTRISPAILDKLSLFYNIDNINDVIADKIYLTVVAFVTENNRSIQ